MYRQLLCMKYSSEALMVAAVVQCPASCSGRLCSRNKVVSQGIALPLEVVYTGPARKWGLTCAQDIPAGVFICEYAGRIITDEEAVSPPYNPAHPSKNNTYTTSCSSKL